MLFVKCVSETREVSWASWLLMDAEGRRKGCLALESEARTLPRDRHSDQGDPSLPAPEGMHKEDGETIYKSLE